MGWTALPCLLLLISSPQILGFKVPSIDFEMLDELGFEVSIPGEVEIFLVLNICYHNSTGQVSHIEKAFIYHL